MPLRYAVVCSSNQNRSMEAHNLMNKRGLIKNQTFTRLIRPTISYRNRRIKEKPERFQDCRERFDVIFTVEERIFDQVMEDLENREKRTNEIVHVINIDVIDNPEDATVAAFMLCELGQKLNATEDLDNSINEILIEFEQKNKQTILHAVSFY
ncbi:unnamed protein product [Adineta ricciae]|uniref:RNA polymerase II subunit A C-terminal domain phosphatase SSU72 n=1 Tax=Adineta ricciae TaxID=249248 RepID=A0A814CEM8_ADIRI|nr:unnamed protein product [Adineta ricciae]